MHFASCVSCRVMRPCNADCITSHIKEMSALFVISHFMDWTQDYHIKAPSPLKKENKTCTLRRVTDLKILT